MQLCESKNDFCFVFPGMRKPTFMNITLLTVAVAATLLFYCQSFAQSPDSSTRFFSWSLHFQQTIVEQYYPSFTASYSGANSFSDAGGNALSLTTTLFSGLRLRNIAELYFDPEISGGSGLSKVQGIAGFPNNEVVRIGTVAPSCYIARLFVQRTFNFGKSSTSVDDDVNQLSDVVSDNRLVFRIGKFSALDYFDNNSHSHDGRMQFMDWALVSNGAWDYPADTHGYTIGFTAEYLNASFSARFLAAMVSTKANGEVFDQDILANNGLAAEVDKPYLLFGQAGKARLLLYLNRENSVTYQDAFDAGDLNLSGNATADSLGLRHSGTAKYGAGVNIEQAITGNTGVFFRAGWNDGRSESWMYTEIDQTISAGILAKGAYWKRGDDAAGVALVCSGLSDDHRRFLQAGGYGFILGDGALNYGPESVLEAYYSLSITKFLQCSVFYQFVNNPGYNRDRGPVNIGSIRAHIEL